MKIVHSKKFLKQTAKLDKKIYLKLEVALRLFAVDQFHPSLRNHSLQGDFSHLRSIDITGDWRAIY